MVIGVLQGLRRHTTGTPQARLQRACGACRGPRSVVSERKASDRVESLLEAIGMRALGLRERLEPVGNLAEALLARLLGHAGIHVRVLVSLARDRRLEVQLRLADRQARGGVAYLLQVLEVAVSMTRLTFGRRTEHGGHVVEALDVGLGGEVQISPICLRFARKCILQVLLGPAALEIHDATSVSKQLDWV